VPRPARDIAGPLRALTWGALAVLALRTLAAMLPGRWLWGLDLARDLPPAVAWSSLLLCLLACWPAATRALARTWPTRGLTHALIALASSLALALFLLGHPDETLFTGDTALRHGEFTTVAHPEAFAPQALRGDLFLHHTLPRAIARVTPLTPEAVGRAQGALLALLTALAGWRLARALGARGVAAAAVAALAAGSAALALDNGYSKATVEVACLTTLIAPGLVRLAADGGGLAGVGACVAAALLLHRSALALVLVWVVGAALALRQGRGREPLTWLGLVLPLLALGITLPAVVRVIGGFDRFHHLTAEGSAPPFAAVLRGTHLLDVANVLCLLAPSLLLLPWLFATRPRPEPRALLLFAALALPPVLLVVLVPPQHGLPRDWDVFAFAGSALAAVAAWRVATIVASAPREAQGAALAPAFVALLPALQWAALPADPVRFMARAESILESPPQRGDEERAQGLATLGLTRYTRGDPRGGRRLFLRSMAISPHPRRLVEWGTVANLSGRPEEAILYFLRSTEIDPNLESAWQGVAESAEALADTVHLREATVQLQRLDPGGAPLKAARERLQALATR
jgi:tetratricopeptide (TPR) repeat protein